MKRTVVPAPDPVCPLPSRLRQEVESRSGLQVEPTREVGSSVGATQPPGSRAGVRPQVLVLGPHAHPSYSDLPCCLTPPKEAGPALCLLWCGAQDQLRVREEDMRAARPTLCPLLPLVLLAVGGRCCRQDGVRRAAPTLLQGRE